MAKRINDPLKNASGIYALQSVVKDHRYGDMLIGQSRDIALRKRTHFFQLKQGVHGNQHIQNFYNKYGSDSLKFILIMKCLESELDVWEKWFIKSFDSIKNGFNIREGGNGGVAVQQCIECTMTNMFTNETVTFRSINEFARFANVKAGLVGLVMKEKRKYVGEWYCPFNKWRPKTYTVIDPKNKEWSFINIEKFMRDHDIGSWFRRVLNEKILSCQGWRLNNQRKSNRKKTSFKLIHDSGEIAEEENLYAFALKRGFNPTGLWRVTKGETQVYKGWRLLS